MVYVYHPAWANPDSFAVRDAFLQPDDEYAEAAALGPSLVRCPPAVGCWSCPRSTMHDPIIASVSGGKDSTALCLWLQERGVPYTAVHMDTGWEHPLTDTYIREVLEPRIGPITWIVPERGFAALCRRKGIFPSRSTRFCTEHLKMLPFLSWIEEHHPDGIVSAIGIRAAESGARANLPRYERTEWGWTWRPLLAWSEADVIAIHKRHHMAPNPLYLPPYNCSRVGCWPCIFARKAEIAMIARLDPGRIDLIRQLEAELWSGMTRVGAQIGPPRWIPSMFCHQESLPRGQWIWNHDRQKWKRYRTVSMPIDQVVEWALEEGPGSQVEMFHEEDRSGCLRWGMCDAE